MRFQLLDEDLKHRIRGRYTADAVSECWNWIAAIAKKSGYGLCNVRHVNERLAHRVSYRAFKGRIPDGLKVLHTCDNRRCVNPDHLFLGTTKDNAHDARAKGRHAHGERSVRAKLTEEQVREILRLYKTENTAKELAERFGVTDSTIQHIYYGTRWAHMQR